MANRTNKAGSFRPSRQKRMSESIPEYCEVCGIPDCEAPLTDERCICGSPIGKLCRACERSKAERFTCFWHGDVDIDE